MTNVSSGMEPGWARLQAGPDKGSGVVGSGAARAAHSSALTLG